jgi:ribonuclease P protein component
MPAGLTFGPFLHRGARLTGRRSIGGLLHCISKDYFDEADLSAEQYRAQAPARLPQPQRHAGRPQGACSPPRARPRQAFCLSDLSPTLRRLTRRADFLAANQGRRVPMPGFVLLVRPRDDGDLAIGVGFTVTKKVGNAVIRNRMKRRFRELARLHLPQAGIAGADHVLIGRSGGIERDYAALDAEFRKALAKVAR